MKVLEMEGGHGDSTNPDEMYIERRKPVNSLLEDTLSCLYSVDVHRPLEGQYAEGLVLIWLPIAERWLSLVALT